jgi:hypothetical protein
MLRIDKKENSGHFVEDKEKGLSIRYIPHMHGEKEPWLKTRSLNILGQE